MNNSPAEIIAALLIANDIFGDPEAPVLDWPLYINDLPDKKGTKIVPDNCAAIFDMEGVKDGRLMTGENIKHRGVAIQVRSRRSADGWVIITQAEEFLERVFGQVVSISTNNYTLKNISQTGPAMLAGLEEGNKQRAMHVVNFLTTIEVGGSGSPDIVTTSGARRIIRTYTADHAVLQTESNYALVGNGAGPITFTLPPWQEGLTFEFYNNTAFLMTVATSGSDKLKNYSGLWDMAASAEGGSKIQVVATVAGTWAVETLEGSEWDLE